VDSLVRVARMRAGKFRATPGDACRCCDYRAMCPERPEPARAIERVRAVRPGAIETPEQEAFVEQHAAFGQSGRAA